MCFHLLARPGRIRRIRSALLRSRALRIAQAVQAVQPWQWCRLTGLQVARGSHRRQALRTQASAAHSTLLHLGMHAARETDAATDTGSVPPPAPVPAPARARRAAVIASLQVSTGVAFAARGEMPRMRFTQHRDVRGDGVLRLRRPDPRHDERTILVGHVVHVAQRQVHLLGGAPVVVVGRRRSGVLASSVMYLRARILTYINILP